MVGKVLLYKQLIIVWETITKVDFNYQKHTHTIRKISIYNMTIIISYNNQSRCSYNLCACVGGGVNALTLISGSKSSGTR